MRASRSSRCAIWFTSRRPMSASRSRRSAISLTSSRSISASRSRSSAMTFTSIASTRSFVSIRRTTAGATTPIARPISPLRWGVFAPSVTSGSVAGDPVRGCGGGETRHSCVSHDRHSDPETTGRVPGQGVAVGVLSDRPGTSIATHPLGTHGDHGHDRQCPTTTAMRRAPRCRERLPSAT